MESAVHSAIPNNVRLFMPPDAFKTETEMEMQLQHRLEHDPHRPPRKRPGDGYIFLCLIVGLVVGAGLGAVVGLGLNFTSVFGAVVVGGIACGAVGALTGDAVRKRRRNKARGRRSQ